MLVRQCGGRALPTSARWRLRGVAIKNSIACDRLTPPVAGLSSREAAGAGHPAALPPSSPGLRRGSAPRDVKRRLPRGSPSRTHDRIRAPASDLGGPIRDPTASLDGRSTSAAHSSEINSPASCSSDSSSSSSTSTRSTRSWTITAAATAGDAIAKSNSNGRVLAAESPQWKPPAKRPMGRHPGDGGGADCPTGQLMQGPADTEGAVNTRRLDSVQRNQYTTDRRARVATFSAIQEAKRINQAIMDAGARRRYDDILQVTTDNGPRLNHVNAATALHRLGSCGLEPGGKEARRLLADPRFRQLEVLAEKLLPFFSAREVANCLWALAKLGYQPAVVAPAGGPDREDGGHPDGADDGAEGGRGAGLLRGLCDRAAEAVTEFRPQEVTNTLWALGTLGHQPGEGLLGELTGRLLEVLPGLAPQGISNSLLGLAKLGWSPGPGVLDQVAHGSLDKVAAFEPQTLSNTLWALARLEHRHDQLQAAIFRQALGRVASFNPQGTANLVWAAACLRLELGPIPSSEGRGGGAGAGGGDDCSQQQQAGHFPELLLRRLCDQAVASGFQGYTPQNIANLVWATAKLGYLHEPLLRAAASRMARQLTGSPSPAVDRISAGTATGTPGPDRLDGELRGAPAASSSGGSGAGGGGANSDGSGAGGGASSGGSGWKAQEVANISWAFATLGFHPGDLCLGQVCRHLSSPQCLATYNWQELANTLWALAVLRHRDEQALRAVAAGVLEQLGSDAAEAATRPRGGVTPQPTDVAMLLWSYGTLRQPAPGLFKALLPILARHLPLFTDPELVDCVWAAATLGLYDARVMDAVAEHLCAHRLPRLQPHHVASLAWTYDELRHAHKALMDGLVERGVSYVMTTTTTRGSSPADGALGLRILSRLCGAAGIFGWSYPLLLDAAAERIPELCLTYMKSRQAGVRANPSSEERPALVASNLLWGLSLLGGCSPQIWSHLMALLVREAELYGGVRELPEEALGQVYQAHLHVRLDHPGADLEPGPPGLMERAIGAWRLRNVWGVQVSAFQQEVAGALDRLGLPYTVELLIDDGTFSIDLALELRPGSPERAVDLRRKRRARGQRPGDPSGLHIDGRSRRRASVGGSPVGVAKYDKSESKTSSSSNTSNNSSSKDTTSNSSNDSATTNSGSTRPSDDVIRVAVEVDGPSHFTVNTRQPLGTTLYRRRCLAARGWVVVSVPYWRWHDAGVGHKEQEALLEGLMAEAGLELETLRRAATGSPAAAAVAAGLVSDAEAPGRRGRRRRRSAERGDLPYDDVW